MSGHTKTPWERLIGYAEPGHPIYKPGKVVVRIVQKREPGQATFTPIALVDSENAQEDAAILVRAVNSHDQLVGALNEARLQIEYLHGKFTATGSGNAVLDRINAALSLAEPPS